MPFVNSQREQFTGIVPTDPTAPTVPTHLQGIVDAVEEQVVLRAADWSAANTLLTPFSDGMLLYVADVGDTTAGLFVRDGGLWHKIWPTNYTGTGDPSASLGADGDLYFQTA